MPSAGQFINTKSELYAKFGGKQLNDVVMLPNGLGFENEYRISDIDSAYRHLGGRAEAVNREAVSQNGSMFSIHMPMKEDGEMDLTEIMKVLTARTSRVDEIFEIYRSGPATLGMLGKLLGVNAMVVSGDWPTDPKPKLYVCQGTVPERATAESLLTSGPKSVVLDLTALNELVANNLESTLKLAQTVYVSTSAVEVLDELILSAQTERARGQMREEGGRISMVEYGDDYHQERLDYLQRLRQCVEEYCEVVPAWGNEELPQSFPEIGPHLGDDSYDALLLCLERDALLLTLDGRLREIAKALGNIDGIWPQVFCDVALAENLCPDDAYRNFVIWSIQRRRTHTALSAMDILWIFKCPEAVKKPATAAIVAYVAEPTVEIGSITSVIAEVAKRMLVSGTTPRALFQFLYRATAPLFARTNVDADGLARSFFQDLSAFMRLHFTKEAALPAEVAVSLQKQDTWKRHIEASIAAAKRTGPKFSVADFAAHSFCVKLLYVAKAPLYVGYGPTESRDLALQHDLISEQGV